MAMADLASHSIGKPISLAEIAERQEISLSYLEQLFSKLRRAALVKSVRGPGGGYLLGSAADKIRIFDIILAVDEPVKTTRCNPMSPTGCHGELGRCTTHDLWEGLGNQIRLFLSAITLEDVLERRIVGAFARFQTEPSIPASAAE
jgi:Rrf2 family iron-sulfur cluster assembly transcriptional regulator